MISQEYYQLHVLSIDSTHRRMYAMWSQNIIRNTGIHEAYGNIMFYIMFQNMCTGRSNTLYSNTS